MTQKSDMGASGHRQRLRERLRHDPEAVADYEVLELFLGLGLLRKDTKPLAKCLLNQFGSIRGVLDARPEELELVHGFGPGLLALWRLIREVMARYVAAPILLRETLCTPEAVAAMARQRLGNLGSEESWIALVDAQNRLITWECLRRGSVSSVALNSRDVLEVALLRKASGIILVHNHPGGNPKPSQADLNLTGQLQKLAPELGLRLLDHVIVTSGDCYSIAARKLIRLAEVK